MNISHLERYKLASLLATVLIMAYYISGIFRIGNDSVNLSGELLRLYITIVVVFAVMHIVFAVILPKHSKSGDMEKDERDLMIESKSYRNSYFFLIVAVNSVIAYVFVSETVSFSGTEINSVLFKPYAIFHILFIVLFISYIVELATQMYYYRRGF